MTKKDLCNKCQEQIATKTFDHEKLCESCTIDRLIAVVERLSTAYVTIDAEVRYEDGS